MNALEQQRQARGLKPRATRRKAERLPPRGCTRGSAGELAYWSGERSNAVMVYTAKAYEDGSGISYMDAIALHTLYPVEGSAVQVQLLHMANEDLAAARAQMNDMLAAAHTAWWDVQDVHLSLLEAGLGVEDINPGQRTLLEGYATSGEAGAANAQSWLASVGEAYLTEVILPSDLRAASIGNNAASIEPEQSFLSIHPNPTSSEAYIVFRLPEGATTAWLEVVDATGRVVQSRGMSGDSGIVELPKSLLQPGLYHVGLKADGVRIANVKFTSIR